MHPTILSAIESIRTSKRELLFQIILIFIVPIVLIDQGIIPIRARVSILVLLVTLLVIVLTKEKWTGKMLGLMSDNFRRSVLPYTIFTLSGALLITQFGELVGNEEVARWWTHSHFLYMFFIVSLFQEIAYRGYLIPALGKLTNVPIYIILTNAILFTYLHTIFPNPLWGLPMAFIGGLGFAYMYTRYPNIVLIVISHSVLNFFAVLYGFYVIPGITY